MRILSTIGPMNHKLDMVKKRRVDIWELRRHKAINVLWGAQLGLRMKEDNDMGMWKTPLLELNSIEVGSPST
jgi:hypothetical protein